MYDWVPAISRALFLEDAPRVEELPTNLQCIITKVMRDECDLPDCVHPIHGRVKNAFLCEGHFEFAVKLAYTREEIEGHAFTISR